MTVENQAGNSFDSTVGGLLQRSQHSTPHIRSFCPIIRVEAHAKNLAWSQVITQKWRISIATTVIPSAQLGRGHTRGGNDGGLGLSFTESSPGTCRLSPQVKNFCCKYWRSLIFMVVGPDYLWSGLSGQIHSELCCPWSGKQNVRTNTSRLSFISIIRCLANGQKLSYVQNWHRPHDPKGGETEHGTISLIEWVNSRL